MYAHSENGISNDMLLLLPVYWYALNYEDYHQWSARREMVVQVTKKMR